MRFEETTGGWEAVFVKEKKNWILTYTDTM